MRETEISKMMTMIMIALTMYNLSHHTSVSGCRSFLEEILTHLYTSTMCREQSYPVGYLQAAVGGIAGICEGGVEAILTQGVVHLLTAPSTIIAG